MPSLTETIQQPVKPLPARLKTMCWLDAALLVSICALEVVRFTGLVLHEWLGLAIVAMVAAHLLLSWAWVASATRQIFTARSLRTRVNYVLNLCLFASVTGVLFSGILISQYAVPALTRSRAVTLLARFQWDHLHGRFSDFVVIFAGLHLAINWDWALAAARKILRTWEGGL